MKKLLSMAIALVLLTGCATSNQTATSTTQIPETPTTVSIEAYDKDGNLTTAEVPANPTKVATLDMAALDIIQALGKQDTVVASSQTSLEYLQDIVNNKNVTNAGTVKEADFEALMAAQPEVIFIGGRLANFYEELSKIAPVVFLKVDTDKGVLESVKENAKKIATIYGVNESLDTVFKDYEERIAKLNAFAKDKSAIVALTTTGSMNILNEKSRGNIISKEIGFTSVGNEFDSSTHGSEASFEYVVEKNPDYIFVVDRDAAIMIKGAKLAQEIMDNALIQKTSAYQNNQIIYLAHPAIWYIGEGGITALDYMLKDVETIRK